MVVRNKKKKRSTFMCSLVGRRKFRHYKPFKEEEGACASKKKKNAVLTLRDCNTPVNEFLAKGRTGKECFIAWKKDFDEKGRGRKFPEEKLL